MASELAEYKRRRQEYDRAISKKRSLLMAIRMNKAWSFKRGKPELIKKLSHELAMLIIPYKPTEPVGYQIYTADGDYEGYTRRFSKAQEHAKSVSGSIVTVSAITNKRM